MCIRDSLYFGGDCAVPGVPLDRLLALGAEDYEGGQPGIFNMAVMGLRLAQRANGVSQLHGRVSREMFDGLWPGFDNTEIPIGSITNGVHAPTWVDPLLSQLIERSLGAWDLDDPATWERVPTMRWEDLWATKRELRAQLVADARKRVRKSWIQRGASTPELGWVEDLSLIHI